VIGRKSTSSSISASRWTLFVPWYVLPLAAGVVARLSHQGPVAVHASAIDFDKLHLTTTLNGKVVQSQATNELIFSVPELIETLSMGITLQPGDVIATGTPEGVAAAHGSFLKHGDEVVVSIIGLGELRNKVSSVEPS
jgi:2-keto-4-pentenoate hydratase/2-oxohepta-3-ene-1,7-dioic acid hydratase in catechol pathway